MRLRRVQDMDVRHKRVFVRVDYNVPLENGAITDDTRIRASLPTISWLRDRGAKIILASHLGRPKGQVQESMRLAPAAEALSTLTWYHSALCAGHRWRRCARENLGLGRW